MALTPRDLRVIHFVATYETVLRAQITRHLFPDDGDGRVTRKRLTAILDMGLLAHTHMRTVNPAVNYGIAAPVYFSSAAGLACSIASPAWPKTDRRTCLNGVRFAQADRP